MNNNKIKNLINEECEYQYLRTHKAYKYAKNVIDGKIVAGKYIKKECQRFLDMVDNPESKYYKKYFIKEKVVKKITNILKITNFATGEFAGTSCYEQVAGFQWYILINVYSVFHRDNPKKRRYEKACVFISRRFCGFC